MSAGVVSAGGAVAAAPPKASAARERRDDRGEAARHGGHDVTPARLSTAGARLGRLGGARRGGRGRYVGAVAAFDVDEMVADLRALVEVESPSRDAVALTTSAAAVAALIERRLGRAPDVIDGPAGPHVHLRPPAGTSAGVLVVGHHDTVSPLGTLARRPFAVVDGRATGPGVFDMKGGIVVAVHAIAAGGGAGVELLITADEEVGSESSRR